MRFNLYLLYLLAGIFTNLYAQNTGGLTGIPDTSFTLNSALKNVQKVDADARLGVYTGKSKIAIQHDIVYHRIGSRSLKVDLFNTKKLVKKELPVIIFIFGGGWRSGDKTHHHEMAKELASRGYAVFTPEYRLSTEALYPAAMQDITACIQWVKTNATTYHLNKNKVTVIGFSAGGQMAALLGVTAKAGKFNSPHFSENAEVQAVVDLDGILAYIHPESAEGDDRKRTSAATYYFGYTKEQNPALWNEASALYKVHQDVPPYLFINSGNDRMHAGRNDFCDKLGDYGIDYQIHTFATAPHVFPLLEKWFMPVADLIDQFLTLELALD